MYEVRDHMHRIARSVVGLCATSVLMGQLSMSAMFDSSPDVTPEQFEAYNCAVLASSLRFPDMLRSIAPSIAMLVCTLGNFVQADSSHGDLVATVVPSTVGLVLIASALTVMQGMCTAEEMGVEYDPAATRWQLGKLHLGLGVVLVVGMVAQLLGLRGELEKVMRNPRRRQFLAAAHAAEHRDEHQHRQAPLAAAVPPSSDRN